MLAKKLVLNSIIDETQSGFMSGKHIVNNVSFGHFRLPRVIWGEWVYSILRLLQGLWYGGASVHHKPLKKFGLYHYFLTAIETLYKC